MYKNFRKINLPLNLSSLSNRVLKIQFTITRNVPRISLWYQNLRVLLQFYTIKARYMTECSQVLVLLLGFPQIFLYLLVARLILLYNKLLQVTLSGLGTFFLPTGLVVQHPLVKMKRKKNREIKKNYCLNAIYSYWWKRHEVKMVFARKFGPINNDAEHCYSCNW